MDRPPIDLAAYRRRIGHAGPTSPTLATLAALQAAHVGAIPFENLDPLLGRPVPLDAVALQDKLVHRRRGGYCFEHGSLFRFVLEALGFTVTAYAARVVYRRPPDVVPPRTHMLLRVDLPEGPFLTDVGFGGPTPTAPLALVAGIEQATPLEPFRLVELAGELALQIRQQDGWQTLYRFAPAPQQPIDLVVANWFVATHPESRFVNRLIVARSTESGRMALVDLDHSVQHPGRQPVRRRLADAAAVPALLEREFGLVLTDNECEALVARLDALAKPPG
ncbi:MAG: arylamine N-acetyltransferase [Geminicoccaceae bacterium]